MRGIRADKFTYSALIDACAKGGRVEQAFLISDVMAAAGVEKDQTVYSALIDACGRCGAVSRAFLVFDEMKRAGVYPNLVTFAVLIDCCGDAHMPDRAFEVFREIKHWQLTPNVVAYTSLIDACAKAGWPERAELVYDDMLQAGVKPNEVTFGALLDAWLRVEDYARAAAVVEASYRPDDTEGHAHDSSPSENVKFKIRPSVRVFNALLSVMHNAAAIEAMYRVLVVMRRLNVWPPMGRYAEIIVDVADLARLWHDNGRPSWARLSNRVGPSETQVNVGSGAHQSDSSRGSSVEEEDESSSQEEQEWDESVDPLNFGIWLTEVGTCNNVHRRYAFSGSVKKLLDAAEYCGHLERVQDIRDMLQYLQRTERTDHKSPPQ
eukprot:CAMPEP_0185847572 /NCGR_PEP_ID=MMETSP1354-20130828/2797_1 /TAXON_ID=708628 /ORGANISM="Erythrolobus madagascarensis, Strain CCMP3276" /LENGTH=377 /DNA_ID=CAMNT_0028547885 /DNA_START=35 /DNA_END=1168 /DNA_ORIENTATION=-